MTEDMTWVQVIVLSLIQGLTEFLPVSSSGHLNIFSELFFGADAGASFTAVIQLGTEAAVLVYFAKDIVNIIRSWFRGILHPEHREDPNYKLGWYVIIGSIPIGIIGLLFRDEIRDAARNLWLTASVLILFSFVFIIAERFSRQDRPVNGKSLKGLRLKDAIVMGFAQCLALVPGVSRSGGTISAGLFLHMNREAATRFSFLLAIPAVTASGLFSLPDAFAPGTGQAATGIQLFIGGAICFVVGYITIAWLLRFVQNHSLSWFAGYRIILGVVVLVLLSTGVMSAT